MVLSRTPGQTPRAGDRLTARSRSRQLALKLRERLLSGYYRPGQWIRETTLRQEFGVSNGPVREALQELIADKLLERVPYCGVRVIALEPRDIVELFQLRSALMELGAELAAQRRDPAAIAKIDDVLAVVKRHFDEERPFVGTLTTWLAEASGSARLAQAWQELFRQTQLYVPETRTHRKNFALAFEHISGMCAAIAAGEAERARTAVRALTRVQVEALGYHLLI